MTENQINILLESKVKNSLENSSKNSKINMTKKWKLWEKDKLHRRPIQDPILELLQFYSEGREIKREQ